MSESCLAKQEKVKELFQSCTTQEARYQLIIDLGRTQKPLALHEKTETARVKGCQSNMFLKATYEDGFCHFQTEADALISAGLGVLLTMVYDHELPETVLKCPPTFLEELQIHASLTPNRSNGLSSLYLHMKQQALLFFTQKRPDS